MGDIFLAWFCSTSPKGENLTSNVEIPIFFGRMVFHSSSVHYIDRTKERHRAAEKIPATSNTVTKWM